MIQAADPKNTANPTPVASIKNQGERPSVVIGDRSGSNHSIRITGRSGNKITYEVNGEKKSIKAEKGADLSVLLNPGDSFTVGRDVDLSDYDLLIQGNKDILAEYWKGIRVRFEPGSVMNNVSISGTQQSDDVTLANRIDDNWPAYYSKGVTIKGSFNVALEGNIDFFRINDQTVSDPEAKHRIGDLTVDLGADGDQAIVGNVQIEQARFYGKEGVDGFKFGSRVQTKSLLLDGGEQQDVYDFSSALYFSSERVAIQNKGDIINVVLSEANVDGMELETRNPLETTIKK